MGEERTRLFVKTARSYHRAFAETRSASPEQALRYPYYLKDKNLPGLLGPRSAGAGFTKSDLLYLLVRVSAERPLEAPAVGWSCHHATFLVERHAVPRCAGVDLRRAP